MKAIILAAGMGRRLAAMGWEKPKCLLPFGDSTLIGHLLAALTARGIQQIVVVVGYKRELVESALESFPGQVHLIGNEDYGSTNTINSLWRTREHLTGDFLYFNADVLFDPRILDLILAPAGSALAIDAKACSEEEVKVIMDGHDVILRIGKALASAQCEGEFIGIGKFGKAVCPALVASLERYNLDLGRTNLFFEAAVDDIVADHTVLGVRIGDLCATEIDSPDDFAAASRQWRERFSS